MTEKARTRKPKENHDKTCGKVSHSAENRF